MPLEEADYYDYEWAVEGCVRRVSWAFRDMVYWRTPIHSGIAGGCRHGF